MSATRTTLDSLLKDFYLGPVVEQLNNEMLVLQMYEKMSVDWSGRQTIIPIHVARTTSVGFAGESTGAAAGGVLPTPIGQQTYQNLAIVARYLYGTFRISGPAVASAKNGGKGAFIGWMEAEMDRLVTDVKNEADNKALLRLRRPRTLPLLRMAVLLVLLRSLSAPILTWLISRMSRLASCLTCSETVAWLAPPTTLGFRSTAQREVGRSTHLFA